MLIPTTAAPEIKKLCDAVLQPAPVPPLLVLVGVFLLVETYALGGTVEIPV
jgi:hypothetical protein